MNVIRMIKLFAWEPRTEARIASKREDELVWIRRRQWLELVNYSVNYLSPILVMMVTFVT